MNNYNQKKKKKKKKKKNGSIARSNPKGNHFFSSN